MTRYLEIKPGSIAEVAIRLRDDYQAFFKKELEKSGKGIAQMSDAEKKAFFNRVDKAYNAKNEATSQDVSQSLATKPKQEPKTKSFAESFDADSSKSDDLTKDEELLIQSMTRIMESVDSGEIIDISTIDLSVVEADDLVNSTRGSRR